MSEPLRVYVMPCDHGGIGWHRMRFPALGVEQLVEGVTVTLGDDDREADPEDYDVVVFNNAVWPAHVELVSECHARGIAVVVDVDDDVERVPEKNIAHGFAHSGGIERLKAVCAAADLVTVSTPNLLPYGGDRAHLLRNCVPGLWSQIPRYTGPRVLTWSGAIAWHVDDLESTGGGVGAALASRPDVLVRVVGYGDGVRQALSLHPSTELVATGWVDMGVEDGYALELAAATVGIAPITSSRFAHAKSALKGLEYAICGVPFIGSADHPEYQRLCARGIGALARNRSEWQAAAADLLDEHEWREDVAAKAREIVMGMTYEANAWRWAEAWQRAVKNFRIRRARHALA